MRRAKSLAWIGGVGLLGLTPAMGLAQGLPLPPAPAGVSQTQTLPVAPTAAASQDVQQTGATDQPRIARPRDLVQVGVENHRKGEFEIADVYLKKAQELRAQLSPAEQKELDAAMQRNTSAMTMRKQGQEQIKRANDAFNAGRTQEATALLKAAQGNMYLSTEDRKSVGVLSDAFSKQSTPLVAQNASQQASMPAGKSYADLVAHARKLLQQGNLDEARSWCIAAAQQGKPRFMAPWDDTDAKVLRDIETAQKRTVATGPTGKVKQLCQQAKNALSAGNVAEAKRLAQQAEAVDAPWFEKESLNELNILIARFEQTGGAAGAATPPVAPMTVDPRAAVREAVAALEKGDVESAERLANSAKSVPNVKYGMFDKTPDGVLADCMKVREQQNGKKAADLLVQARRHLEAGNVDEAEKCAVQSKMLKNSYGMFDFGDRPDKILDECRSKRMVMNRNKSLQSLNEPATVAQQQPAPAKTTQPVMTPPAASNVVAQAPTMPPAPTPPSLGTTNLKAPSGAPVTVQSPESKLLEANRLMAEARRHLTLGEYELALNKATTVKQMGVATHDKPENIYEAVRLAQASRQNAGNSVADAKRTKAVQLLAGARLKLKSGDILGARKDATEAQSLSATYRQGDDLPDAVLAELKNKAKEQVDTYSKAADTLTQRGRHGEAQQYRNYVLNVAMAFNVPAPQMAPGMAKAAAPAVTDVAAQGAKLCGEIENCLKDKQLAQAKKLANALAEGPYGLKVKANEYLAKIDGEETKAAIETSEKHFDLFVRAMNRKDFDVARSYAEKVDKRHLDATKGKHFQELMANPEFQQHIAGGDSLKPGSFVQQAGGQDGPAGKGTQSPLLKELEKKHAIEYQRLRELTLSARGKATRLSQAGNLDGAVTELKTALETVKKADPDVPKVAEMTRQLESAVATYQKMAEQVAFEQEKRDKLDARRNSQIRKAKDEENRREQIKTLMAQHNKFMNDGKFHEAEMVAEKAHAIDPSDVSVNTVRELTRRHRRVHDEELVASRNEKGVVDALSNIDSARRVDVTDGRPMAFDKDHTARSAKRLREYYERIKREKPEQFPSNSRMGSSVSFDFRNKPLIEVIDELRAMSGVNIWVDVQALQYEGIDEKAPISVTLTGVPLKTALDYILRNAQLTYTVSDGVITVTTKQARAITSRKTVHYPVHDLITPRDDMAQLQNHNPDAMPVSGNANMSPFLVAKEDGYNGPSNSGGNGRTMDGQWNKRRTGQTLERQLMSLITSSVEPESWKGNNQGGQGTIEYFPIGMTLVVTQPNDIQEQIQELIKRLRELQEVQITVEVRILTLTDDFFERMGVDFNVLIPDKQTAFDRQVANANFAPPGQLNTNDHLKGVIVGLTPNGNFTNNLDIPISNDSFRQARLGTGFAGIGPPGSAGGLDIGVAFLSSIQVFLVMEAVQGDVRNNTLQAPKVTLFNGQVASISSSRNELFVTSVTAVPNFFTGIPVFIPQQQVFQSGVFLTLQAVVTHDRRYVQLTMSPTIQRVEDSGRSFQSVAGITLQQPVTSNISVATTVMVPDGGTILVGGLKTLQEQRREFGPPILSKIPYLNRLFRNQSYGKAATSLMFMVTPRIIINEEEEEKLGNTFSF